MLFWNFIARTTLKGQTILLLVNVNITFLIIRINVLIIVEIIAVITLDQEEYHEKDSIITHE